MEISFCALRQKKVINIVDGRDLGHVCDLIFEESGVVCGIVVPTKSSSIMGIIKGDSLFVPWKHVCKIGEDVIIVELANTIKNEVKSHDIDKNN